MKARTGFYVCLKCVGVAAVVSAFSSHTRRDSAPQELLSFRLVRDSLQPATKGSVVEVTVRFVVRNVSGKAVYLANECGGSPRYWVERQETRSSGHKGWHQVFSADCTGSDVRRALQPLDSSVFVSRLIQFPAQTPMFAFSTHADVYRFMYVVWTSSDMAAIDIKVASPPVVIRAPN